MLAAVSSGKWEQPIIKPKYDNENDQDLDDDYLIEQNRASSFLLFKSSLPSSIALILYSRLFRLA